MQFLTIEDVADRYRVTPSAIQKQRAEGKPPGIFGRRVGKRILWAPQDLDRWDGLEVFGALDALVLEMRGMNRRLDVQIALTRDASVLLGRIVGRLEEFIPEADEENPLEETPDE